MQLGDDNPFGAIDDEGSGIGHQGHFAHVDLLFANLLDPGLDLLGLEGVLVVDHQFDKHAQRRGISGAAQLTLTHIKFRVFETIADIFKLGVTRVTRNGEYRFECRLQSFVFTLLRSCSCLQEVAE